jgi:hypothetical protein
MAQRLIEDVAGKTRIVRRGVNVSDCTASDIVDVWVERDEISYPDPFFSPKASTEVVQLPKRRKVQTHADLEKALALLARLSDDDKGILAGRIAA